MKKRMCLALYMISVVILIFPSTAKPESGWVVWTKTEFIKTDLSNVTFWEINNAYPKHEQCLQAKKRIWQVYKKEAEENKGQHDTISEIKDVPFEIVITKFKDPKDIFSITKTVYCLPGALDPRERK